MTNNKKIAFLTAAEGIEKAELTEPWAAVSDAGFKPVLISPKEGKVQLFEHLDKADTQPVDVTVADARSTTTTRWSFRAGSPTPTHCGWMPAPSRSSETFVDSGKPVAAICHAPWTLIEADVLRGSRLTSWPSLKTDIRNAGGEWVDESGRGGRQPDHQPQDPTICLPSTALCWKRSTTECPARRRPAWEPDRPSPAP